jgi:hypothetical protein
MMDEVRNGQRKHYLYYETATLSPVGSGAITSVTHTAKLDGMNFYTLPPGTVTLNSGFIYPHHRGKSYANISHSHRQEVSFSDPKINKILIDTAAHFKDVIAWHKRMGYEPVGALDELEDGGIRFVFAEITRERWMEYKAKERARVCWRTSSKRMFTDNVQVAALAKDGRGIPKAEIHAMPPSYDEKKAREIFERLNPGTTESNIIPTVLPVAAEETEIAVQA